MTWTESVEHPGVYVSETTNPPESEESIWDEMAAAYKKGVQEA